MKKIVTVGAVAAFATGLAYNSADASEQTNHTVKAGDTLFAIAQKYNTSVSELKSLNNISSHLIYPNQVIKVSAGEEGVSTQVASKSEAKESNQSGNVLASTYKIQSGDTLYKIAQKYNTSVSALKSLNNLSSDLIIAGHTLKVSGEATPSKIENTTVKTEVKKEDITQNTTNVTTHKVRSGDTLGKIAKQYNTSVAKLQSLNNLSSYMIYAGTTLKVDGEVSKVQAAPKRQVEAKPEPKKAAPQQTQVAKPQAEKAPVASQSTGRTIRVEATHYTAFCAGCIGITAAGYDVRNTIYAKGLRVVAVDPRVIPLGSKVRVSTPYGSFDAIAGDTGGAIKGNRIDILVGSRGEALNLGRVGATVTVLR